MPLDPAQPFALDPAARQADRNAGFERRVAALERNGSQVAAGAGAPSADVRDGALYVDLTALRLYVRANGTWRYAALT